MTIEEVILTKQIEMNNNWDSIKEVETEAFCLFRERLGGNQLLTPVKIDSAKAFETLKTDKHLSKIFSSMLDVYNQLPYHPDMAFDAAWRCLEYEMKLYAQRAWGARADMKLDDFFSRVSKEVFVSLINSDPHLQNAYNSLICNVSLSALKYMTLRLYFRKDLSVAPQMAFVRGRANSILGEELLPALFDAYKKDDGSLDTKGVNDIARRFDRILQGLDVNAGDKTFNAISFDKRIELLLSVVLYSSRCERFHGDIYSPFKSSKAKMTTYYEYYFLTLCCLFFFWLQLYKLVEREGSLQQFVNFDEIENSVCSTIDNMLNILPKD